MFAYELSGCGFESRCNRLINYSYSFRKQPAASVFKNKICCLPELGNMGHHTKNLLSKNLTYSLIFEANFMKIFAAAKVSLILIKSRCRNSCSWMFFKISVLKNFAIFTGKHLRKNTIFNKVAGLQFSCEYCESFKSSFFIKHLRWLLQ